MGTRSNQVGDALSFVCPDEHGDLRSLERFIGRGIPRKRLEGFDYTSAAPPEPPAPPRGPRQQRPQQRRGGDVGQFRGGGQDRKPGEQRRSGSQRRSWGGR